MVGQPEPQGKRNCWRIVIDDNDLTQSAVAMAVANYDVFQLSTHGLL